MDDVALKAAVKRKAEIEQLIIQQKNLITDTNARIAKLQAEQGEVGAWIEMWHRLAGTPGTPTAAERNAIIPPVEKSVKRTRPKNPDRTEIVDKAIELIRARGRPMSRRLLFDALTDEGLELKGKDPEMVLSTMLWRSQDRIVRLPTYGYWVADESYPEADYVSPEYEAKNET